MIINRNGWHYKLLNFTYKKNKGWALHCDGEPKTLCAYFWTFVGNLLEFLLLRLLIIFICITPFIASWSYFMNGSRGAGVVLTAYLMLGATAGIIFLTYFVQDKYRKHEYSKSLSGVGVVLEMVKATKNKVCPFLTYKLEMYTIGNKL